MLDPTLRQVISTTDDAFRPYDRYGTPIAGMSWVPLSGEPGNGEYESYLLRIDAGAGSRPHEHTGIEEFLVVDGEMIDCDGTRYRAGDFVHFEPGSKHSSHSPGGCTLLVMLRGNNRLLDEAEIDTPSA